MIVIQRERPTSIAYYEALLRRISPNSPTYLDRLRRVQAGFAGELYVDREWQEIDLPTTHFLFHNFEFTNQAGYTHQMDTLLLTTSFALIVEIKNMTGELMWDELTHQFTRTTKDGVTEGFRNPFNQAERHVRHLMKIFQKMNALLPITYAVILAQPYAIVKKAGNQPILHASGIQKHVKSLLHHYPPIVDATELKRIANELKRLHCPSLPKTQFQICDVIKGVLCPNCKVAMKYYYSKWRCMRCDTISTEAFYEALQDYRLLIGESISNKEFREFFQITEVNAAYRLLKRLNLRQSGSYKDKRYFIE